VINLINSIKLADYRRNEVYKDGKLLLSNFSESEQMLDLEKTKGNVQGAVEDFYRVKTNIKADPWNTYMQSGDSFETRDGKLLMFDFDWWPVPDMGGQPENWNEVFIYQLKGCNIACPFCFVDKFNNNGKVDHGAKYFTSEEIVDAFLKVRAEKKAQGVDINVFRASGGEPSLVPEQWLNGLKIFKERGLDSEVYFQSDTNLLTGTALESWMKDGNMDADVFKQIAEYKNFGLLSCFKGTDPVNFSENSGCNPEMFLEQFYSFNLLAKSGIKVYPHLVNPNPKTLEGFMDKLAKEYGDEMYGMVHIFSIGMYGSVKGRLERAGVDVEQKTQEWKDNNVRGQELLEEICQKRLGMGYKKMKRFEVIRDLF